MCVTVPSHPDPPFFSARLLYRLCPDMAKKAREKKGLQPTRNPRIAAECGLEPAATQIRRHFPDKTGDVIGLCWPTSYSFDPDFDCDSSSKKKKKTQVRSKEKKKGCRMGGKGRWVVCRRAGGISAQHPRYAEWEVCKYK